MKTKLFILALIACTAMIIGMSSCNTSTQTMLKDSISIGQGDLRFNYVEKYIFNSRTGNRLYKNIDWIHDSGDSIGIVAIDNKRAYVNFNTGKTLTDFDYDKAWIFSCNHGVMVKNDSVYVFRRDGSIVNPKPLYYNNDYALVFHKNLLVICNQEGKVGVIDTTAQWIIQPEYSSISIDYNHDLLNTRKNDVRSVIDFSNNTILSGFYNDINILWEEGIIVTEYNGINRLFSYDGKLIYDVVYSQINELRYETDDEEYRLSNCYIYQSYDGKYGLMNRHYKIVTPPIFYYIEAYSERLFFAKLSYNVGTIIDDMGRTVK